VAGLPFVFGTASFALEGIALVLPVKQSMKNKALFSPMLNAVMILVTMCYMSFAIIGYLFYGKKTFSIITKNLDAGPLATAVRILLSTSLFFTYVIQMFPVSELLDSVFNVDDSTLPPLPIDIDADKTSPAHQQEHSPPHSDSHLRSVDPASAAYKEPTPPASPALVPANSVAASGQGAGLGFALGPSSLPADSARANGNGVHGPPGSVVSVSVLPRSGSEAERTKLIGILGLSAKQIWLRRVLVQCAIRTVLVAITVIIGIVFINFGLIVSLVGSLSNALLAFILPAAFYLRLCQPKWRADEVRPKWALAKFRLLPLMVTVIGSLASIVGIYFAIKEIVSPADDPIRD